MKKGFGIFFIILGALNILRGILSLDAGMSNGGNLLIFGIGFVGLGIWMVSSDERNKTT